MRCCRARKMLWRRGFAPPGWGGAPSPHGGHRDTLSRFPDVRAVLEVVLENLRGQGGGHTLPLRFDGADHFSATDDFGGREPGNFRRQHEANLQLCLQIEQFLRLEQQPGAADVLGCARAPALFTERTISQRKLEIESASSERWNLLFSKNA